MEPLGYLNKPFLKFNNVVKSDSELKIALLRRSPTWRKLENLSDVLAILDKFNFRTIDPENLSIQELYQLISMSSHIITEWGSIESNFILISLSDKVVIFALLMQKANRVLIPVYFHLTIKFMSFMENLSPPLKDSLTGRSILRV